MVSVWAKYFLLNKECSHAVLLQSTYHGENVAKFLQGKIPHQQCKVKEH
jgi:hypothetical protein